MADTEFRAMSLRCRCGAMVSFSETTYGAALQARYDVLLERAEAAEERAVLEAQCNLRNGELLMQAVAERDALLAFALLSTRYNCPICGPMAEGMHHGDECPLAGRFYEEENDG